MLGVKTSGLLFTQPSQVGSLSIGISSLLSGGTVYAKSEVDCSNSVGSSDGFSYFDSMMWKPSCPMFRDCSSSVGGLTGISYFDNNIWNPTCPMFRNVI